MGQSESSPTAGGTPSRKDKVNDGSQGSKRGGSRTQTPPRPSSHLSATTSNPTPAASSLTESAPSRPRSTTSASAPVSMGNSDSKQQRPPSRSSTLQSAPPPAEQRQPSPHSRAMDIPTPSSHDTTSEIDDIVPMTSPFGLHASAFTNPPRLPLPIERDPEPSSPILGPQDTPPLTTPDDADETNLPKRASLVSSSTLDEDEGADIQQFAMETDPLAPKVPTDIMYREGGRHVYVTGTFASWEKKFRMHRGKDGAFHVTIPLAPGTHHLIFLVDGDPKTSMEIPTTVDFANALVNYIEVLAPEATEKGQKAAKAMPIPGAVARESATVPRVDDQPIPSALGATEDELSHIKAIGTSIPNQPPSSLRPHSLPRPSDEAETSPEAQRQRQQQQRDAQQKLQPKKTLPRPKYTSEIPPILAHLDLYHTPNDSRYRLATKACQHLPQPPSLPMFMSKSILNANTPQKDDASVLTMPNHTILNHLATSSIRQGVLATSGTTRYKRKFLTTIMYNSTADSG